MKFNTLLFQHFILHSVLPNIFAANLNKPIGMKILVCVSRTPETTAKIGFDADGKTFDSNNVQYIMNPYDEWYALVRALELKEEKGGSVTVINVGTSASDTVIRKGLAIGADDAIRIDADPQSSLFTATQIAKQVKERGFDIVFVGKETIDYNGSEVGAMLAECLNWPFVSDANHMEMDGDDRAIVSRDIEGGVEMVEVPFPMVISSAKGLAEQRIPQHARHHDRQKKTHRSGTAGTRAAYD